MRKIIALFLILFLVGCTTEVIEVEPETMEPVETPTETPVEPPAEIIPPEPVTPTETSNDTAPAETSTTTAAAHTVEVKQYTFEPREITIKVGESITWINNKPEGKSWSVAEIYVVRGECGDLPKLLSREKVQPGEEITYTFNEVGECTYKDIYHGEYVGTVTIIE